MTDDHVDDGGNSVKLPRRMPQQPGKRFNRKLMSCRIGQEAKRGYAEPQKKYEDRCKFCQGKGTQFSAITHLEVPCTACQ